MGVPSWVSETGASVVSTSSTTRQGRATSVARPDRASRVVFSQQASAYDPERGSGALTDLEFGLRRVK
jgi:hypothetical protein